MSRSQARFVREGSSVSHADDGLSWVAKTGRDGERLRATRDASEMSTGERIGYALKLITNPDSRASIGRSEKQLRRYAEGYDVPLSVLVAISALSGLPIEWIVSGRAKTDREVAEWLHGKDIDQWVDRTDLSGDAPPRQGPDSSTVGVQLLRISASAGPGSFEVASSSDVLELPRQILEKAGVKAPTARVLTASGSSMEPTIGDGDLLLVDIAKDRRSPIEGRIYVLNVGDALFVKRLRRSTNGWMMISDNRRLFADEPIPAGVPVTIHGQVVWTGRQLP